MNAFAPRPRSNRRGRLRLIFSAVCAVVLAATGTTLATAAYADTIITTNQTGTHEGYFYYFWKDTGNASMTLGPGGQYSAQWGDVNNWIGGKGWATGGRRTVSYTAVFDPGGTSYLGLYGWTTNPYVEYYIIESWGNYRPLGTSMGTVFSDCGRYDIYHTQRISQIDGVTYHLYWSVRQKKRTSGTITTGNHFDAWARAGLKLGTFNFMIMATEGWQSKGSSTVTLNSSSADPQPCTSA